MPSPQSIYYSDEARERVKVKKIRRCFAFAAKVGLICEIAKPTQFKAVWFLMNHTMIKLIKNLLNKQIWAGKPRLGGGKRVLKFVKQVER